MVALFDRAYRRSRLTENLIDAADAITSFPDFSSAGSAQHIVGHGGEFGGAGASGTWTDAGGIVDADIARRRYCNGGCCEAVSGIADEGGIILIPIVIFLIILFGGGIYLIYEAPVIILKLPSR